jgi:type IV secretion system protein VirB10
MSPLCEALVALNLTMGVFCQAAPAGKSLSLPEDDKTVWDYKPATLAVATKAPTFPVVVVREQTSPPPPPQEAAPVTEVVSEKVAAPPPPPAPDFYRLAIEAALSAPGEALVPFGVEGVASGGGSETRTASLSPPKFAPVFLPPPSSQKRYDSQGQVSGLPVESARILTADRYISGVLETGLNSQLGSTAGGQAIIQTSRDVFGYHGRNILIPKGSRLICGFDSPGRQGETRIAFNCTRILMAGHRAEILQLAAPVGDVQGRGGVTGEVDNRFWERYGTAFILAGISASVRYASVLLTPPNPDGTQSASAAVADTGSQELSQKLGEITASILEQTVNLKPIITIAQGTRVQVRPAQDWYIRAIGEKQ